jgi:hypothetical protein
VPQILRLRELGGSVSVSAVVSAMGALPSQNAFELLAEDGRYSSPSWSVKGHCHIRPVRDQARTSALRRLVVSKLVSKKCCILT